MDDEILALTDKGRQIALGVISAICHGHSLENVAALNGLDGEDEVKALLLIIASEAGLVGPISA